MATRKITDRIDAITAIATERRSIAPPCPRSVKIELTARCNFACVFCARSMKLRDQADMDRSLFERLLLEMRADASRRSVCSISANHFSCRGSRKR